MNTQLLTHRKDKPHPVDFRDMKNPLLRLCIKEDRSIPWLVRKALKEWFELNHPELLNDMK